MSSEFKYPSDVEGWLSEAEGAELFRVAKGEHVLEIGSFCGLSTICMAQSAVSVTAVDYFDGRGTPSPRNTLRDFRQNVERYELVERIDILHPLHLRYYQDEPEFTMVFIDGAHDYTSVLADIKLSWQLLNYGGKIVFHDYFSERDPGVKSAANDYLGAAWITPLVGSLAIFTK